MQGLHVMPKGMVAKYNLALKAIYVCLHVHLHYSEWSARCYTLNLSTILCYSKLKRLYLDGNLGSKDCRAAFVITS